VINSEGPGCDLLVVAPHTDDAEIGLGGTLHALASRGRRVWVADLTRGELATNATPDERWAEAASASAVLGLTGRVQLELPDGFITPHDRAQAGQVVALVRRLRPRWVVTAPDPVRHPDHVATPELVRRALFLARLQGWQPELGGHRLWEDGAALPGAVKRWEAEARFTVCPDDGRPAVLFDVSGSWEAKRRALACYRSQFGRGDGRTPTTINDPDFMDRIEMRARTWGRRAGVACAEALCGDGAAVLDDLPGQGWSA
jgi:bacillithiol biosynthesis deacetylase BshB1